MRLGLQIDENTLINADWVCRMKYNPSTDTTTITVKDGIFVIGEGNWITKVKDAVQAGAVWHNGQHHELRL